MEHKRRPIEKPKCGVIDKETKYQEKKIDKE